LVISSHDRYGLASSFTLPLRLDAVLLANGQVVHEGDPAPSSGTYSFFVTSPAPLGPTDFAVTVDGQPIPSPSIIPAAGDSTGHAWVVSWPDSFSSGSHDAVITVAGTTTRRVSFTTSNEAKVALAGVLVFPNPFQNPQV